MALATASSKKCLAPTSADGPVTHHATPSPPRSTRTAEHPTKPPQNTPNVTIIYRLTGQSIINPMQTLAKCHLPRPSRVKNISRIDQN
jgi:hypothetical protein